MNRRAFALGLGIALAFISVPTAAQTVLVDVEVHAGPISGRVIHGAPAICTDHGVHLVGHHGHDWGPRHRHAKYDRERRKSERRYDQHLHRLEREHARAHWAHKHCR